MNMNEEVQDLREDWYRSRKAVTNNAAVSVDPGTAQAHWHMVTKQWVQRLLPLDTVEDHAPGLWHDREIGEYTGLREAFDALGERRAAENPLPTEQLAEIGRAADDLTTDLTGLPDDPPLDVDPWEPGGDE